MATRPSFDERRRQLLDAIGEAQSYIANVSQDEFLANSKTQRALQSCLVGIAQHLGDNTPHAPPKLAKLFRETRNDICHDYFAINPLSLWQAATLLPDLRSEVEMSRDSPKRKSQRSNKGMRG